MVRAGEEMKVIDNATKEDLTSLTLAQIIYEQEKQQAEVLPLSALRELVRRSEARLADLREGRVGRFLVRADGAEEPEPPLKADKADKADKPDKADKVEKSDKADAEVPKGLLESSRLTFEEWQRLFDDRFRTLLDTLPPFRQLQEEIKRVTQRMEELEVRILKLSPKRKDDRDDDGTDGPSSEVKE
jgi:hypothetical protein